MESIFVLQDCFERLYALSVPFGTFINNHFDKIDKDWFRKYVLTNKSYSKFKKNLKGKTSAADLDICFQCKLLLNNWNLLKKHFPDEKDFFNNDTKLTILAVRNIRNETMHPVHTKHSYDDLKNYRKQMEALAEKLGTTIDNCLDNLNNSSKEKLIKILKDNVTSKALACDALPEDIKISVRNTEKRLENKRTAKEILDFFYDALKSKRGGKIYEAFQKNNLKGFEDCVDLIEEAFYSDN